MHLLPEERDRCIELLASRGYRVLLGDIDTLAYDYQRETTAQLPQAA